jgi:hypothetical protein
MLRREPISPTVSPDDERGHEAIAGLAAPGARESLNGESCGDYLRNPRTTVAENPRTSDAEIRA